MKRILGIYREKIFSPGKIRADAAILDTALSNLEQMGYETCSMEAEEICSSFPAPDMVLSMAQSYRALTVLQGLQDDLIPVINSVQAVRNCYRKRLLPVLTDNGTPMPEGRIIPLDMLERDVPFSDGTATYWLKRGDVHAVHPDDVVHVISGHNIRSACRHFRRQGVKEVLVQEHVEGETVKFYGVGPDEYFVAFHAPTGKEVDFLTGDLSTIARLSAKALGLEIYGGDAVIKPDGEAVLIDLNDWPSFSMCCKDAARAIAEYTMRFINGGLHEPARDSREEC